MLVGVAPPPPSFPPTGTQAFYFINRPNGGLLCTRLYRTCPTALKRTLKKWTINHHEQIGLFSRQSSITLASPFNFSHGESRNDIFFCLKKLIQLSLIASTIGGGEALIFPTLELDLRKVGLEIQVEMVMEFTKPTISNRPVIQDPTRANKLHWIL